MPQGNTLIVVNDNLVINWLTIGRVERKPNGEVTVTFSDGCEPLRISPGKAANDFMTYMLHVAEEMVIQPRGDKRPAGLSPEETGGFADRFTG